MGLAWAVAAGSGFDVVKDPDARRVDSALLSAASGHHDETLALGVELIRAHPTDWRGWYLRGLAQRVRPLDVDEQRRLEAVRPEQLEDVLRGTLAYLQAAPDAREAVARSLADRHADSALAHTLLASSLLPQGRAEEALEEAARALELDPRMFLAARVQLVGVHALDDPDRERVISCSLLSRFPFDSVVIGTALHACPPDADIEARFSQWEPVVRARRGDAEALLALQRLLAEPSPDKWPSSLKRGIVKLLDPSDQRWWFLGPSLIRLLGGQPLSLTDRRDVVAFLEQLQGSLIAVSDASRDQLLEVTSLLLADLQEAGGNGAKARGGLETALRQLSVLQRPPLMRKLAASECAAGLSRAASSHAADAFVLEHPFQPPPESLPDGCGLSVSIGDPRRRAEELLQRLEHFELIDATGAPRSFGVPAGRSRMLIFWGADCSWSRLEAERLLASLNETTSVFAKYPVDPFWINRDPADRKDRALAWVREAGIDPRSVFFMGDDRRLEKALRIVGTPTLVLVTPEGRIAWTAAGFRQESWGPEVDRILAAMAPPS